MRHVRARGLLENPCAYHLLRLDISHLFALRHKAGPPYHLVPLKGIIFQHSNGWAAYPTSQVPTFIGVSGAFPTSLPTSRQTCYSCLRPLASHQSVGCYLSGSLPTPRLPHLPKPCPSHFQEAPPYTNSPTYHSTRLRICLCVLTISLFLRYYSGRRFLFCPYSFNRRLRRGTSPLCEPPRLGISGKGGIRTHAPVTQPTVLAGPPLEPLGYLSIKWLVCRHGKPLRKTLAHRPIFISTKLETRIHRHLQVLLNQVGSCMIPSLKRPLTF